MHFDYEKSVTRAEALRLVVESWNAGTQTEFAPIADALGRVTAEEIFSQNSLPVYRTSPFDGIAVKAAAFENGIPDAREWVRGVDYIPADTGDDFPDEFDAIVAVEDLRYNDDGRLFFADDTELINGEQLNQPGSLIRKGAQLLPKNTKLTPTHLALLAMGGITHVPVIKKLKAAFVPTGNELVPAGVVPQRGQNIDSNSLMIKSLLEGWGAEPVMLPIVRDDRDALENALDKALEMADIVLINGGSSKGEEDFNSTLMDSKADFFRHGVRAVPGRPVAVAVINGKPVINLPGPVLAAWLAMDWCVCGLVYHYYGLRPPKRPVMRARVVTPIKTPGMMEALLRVNLTKTENRYEVEQISRKEDISKTMNADAMLIVPIGCTGYAEGDEVEVELLKEIEFFD